MIFPGLVIWTGKPYFAFMGQKLGNRKCSFHSILNINIQILFIPFYLYSKSCEISCGNCYSHITFSRMQRATAEKELLKHTRKELKKHEESKSSLKISQRMFHFVKFNIENVYLGRSDERRLLNSGIRLQFNKTWTNPNYLQRKLSSPHTILFDLAWCWGCFFVSQSWKITLPRFSLHT